MLCDALDAVETSPGGRHRDRQPARGGRRDTVVGGIGCKRHGRGLCRGPCMKPGPVVAMVALIFVGIWLVLQPTFERTERIDPERNGLR